MDFALILVCTALSALVAASPADKNYRTDYVYNKKTDAFYKLHIEAVWNREAQAKCDVEGAKLMMPDSKEDIVQLHSMLKKYPDIGDLVWVGFDGKTHESAEETPMVTMEPEPDSYGPEDKHDSNCDVVTRTGEIETIVCYTRRLPFICKVEASDAHYDERCQVYSKSYHYSADVGSCYKVPNIALRWNEAVAECKKEGAHLIVLNSQKEADTIKQFLKTAPSVRGAYRSYFYYAGIRAMKPKLGQPREFRSIFNETLEQTGCGECWSTGEPNNYLMLEDCGSVFSGDGRYNDVDCTDTYGFICEKEIHV